MKRKAKKRPGRPSATGGREKLTTTLSPVTIKWLRVMGVGSISGAIEAFVGDEIAENGEFWEQSARDNGWWDESMKRKPVRPVNQTEKQT